MTRDKFMLLVKFIMSLRGIASFAFSLVVSLLSSLFLSLATLFSTTVGDSYGVLTGLLTAGVLMAIGWRLFPLLLIASLGVLDAIWNIFLVYKMIGVPRNYLRSKVATFMKLKEGER